MEKVKLTKEQEILFDVYDKGVQNEDCDLDAYVEKMKKALSIALVSQQRELLIGLLTKLENGGGSAFIDKEQIVDDYLKAN